MSKILTVFGATGNQGGSVVKAVLSHPSLSSTYKIRAVTRDASKPAAQELTKKGCEVVVADLSDPTSVKQAIEGATAVFAVTDFWSHMNKDKEVAQGKSVAEESKACGVKHLVWSSLPHVTKLTNGQLKHVLHFDSKAEVSEHIEAIKGADLTATHFMPAFYMSNLKNLVQPAQGKADEFTVGLPWGSGDGVHFPILDIEADTGKFVAGILAAEPSSVNGKFIQGVSEWVTPNQVAQKLSKATGKTFTYVDMDPEVWSQYLPPAIAGELKENMLLMRDFSYYGQGTEKKQAESDKVLAGAKTTTLEEWAKGKW